MKPGAMETVLLMKIAKQERHSFVIFA